MAVSCGKVYFDRCCALKRTGTLASESKVTCLFDCLSSDVLMVSFLTSIWANNYFESEKSRLLNKLLSKNVYLSLLNSRKRKINFIWFSLARLPTKTARIFFLSHFLRKKLLSLDSSSFSLLLPTVKCLDKTCCTFSSPTYVKYYRILKTLRHFKTQGEKNKTL